MVRAFTLISILAVVCASPALAGITTATYDLMVSDHFSSQNFGTVGIVADDVAGTVTFTVTPEKIAAYGQYAWDFGIDSFGWNFDSAAFTNSPSGWSVAGPTNWWNYFTSSQSQTSAFGHFDVAADRGWWGGSQNPLSFTLTLPSSSAFRAIVSNFADANEKDYVFAAHVVGYSGTRCSESQWVAARASDLRVVPIPVPGAIALGLLGLAGLRPFRRVG